MQAIESFAPTAATPPADAGGVQGEDFSFRDLVEHAQTGMFIVQDGLFKYANPKLLEMIGCTEADLVNKREAGSIVHPNDRSRFEEHVRQRIAGVEGTAYEVHCLRTDGSAFDARVCGRRVVHAGRPADLITLTDVTELTQATEKLKRNYLTSIKVFSNLIELRGHQLVGHGRRVADLARALAKALHCTPDEAQDVFVAGLLHDVGLIGMSDAGLDKPIPKLDAAELASYREHAAVGEHSLMALEDMQPVAKLIRSHHERFDGTGFPDRLHGADIPWGARVLAIVDTYDDLLHGQMGVERLTLDEVRTLLQHGRGNQFDPDILQVFLDLHAVAVPQSAVPLKVGTAQLQAGMVLAADLVSPRGVLMLPMHHLLTPEMIERIRHFEQRDGGSITLQVHRAAQAGGPGKLFTLPARRPAEHQLPLRSVRPRAA